MRLFVAVDLSPELTSELEKIEAELADTPLRFMPPKDIHLTLKFLGEVQEAKLDKVKVALSEVAFSPFKLQTTKLGTFPRVFWLGVKLTKDLAQLQKNIQRAVRPFALNDPRPYKPHLTIARFRSPDDRKHAVDRRIEIKWKVEHFTLYKSTLTPRGPVYEALARFS